MDRIQKEESGKKAFSFWEEPAQILSTGCFEYSVETPDRTGKARRLGRKVGRESGGMLTC